MNRQDSRVNVQPARQQWTCAKAKKTYGGFNKESLAQSRVFPMERWSKSRENVGYRQSGRSHHCPLAVL
ncbi:hypothetical protein Taro_027653 [Colocasia esculenta]|uniref:Uncharacterized protein n=1 Tax=Colocasia esculenta TaxID=4460 RepID=A0A843VKR5_COLES|nr:hypothetical protein [Colocasia esculenta]